MNLAPPVIEEAVRRALAEDLGHGHDITSELLVPEGLRTTAVMRAREEGVLAGLPCAIEAFRQMSADIILEPGKKDGERLAPGDEILKIEGPARALLTAERTALNFVTMLSGIATQTTAYVDAVTGTHAKIVCTRKTMPGLRALQKYAVRMGGGYPHRHGLDDAILIKDNHIALAGSAGRAIELARSKAGHMVKIEIEVDNIKQLEEVLNQGGADCVLLDNMTLDEMRECVQLASGRVILEASGNVNLDTVGSIAETGVDVISAGALTHSFKSLDIGLDINF